MTTEDEMTRGGRELNGTTGSASGHSPQVPPEGPTLKRVLGLPGVLLQGLTHIAPAAGLIFGVGYIASLAGLATPLDALMAGFIALTLAIGLTQLAKHMPSSGGYFTYVSGAVAPEAGWMTAWLSFAWYPLNPPGNLIFAGFFIDESLRSAYGIHIPWWAFLIVMTTIIGMLMYRGIALSIRVMTVLASAEILILVILGLTGVIHSGPGGVTGTPFLPSHALSGNGLFLGVIFFISNFGGFESVAPLGEEARNPRRTIPRALILGVCVATFVYVFCSWAYIIGWGTKDIHGFATSVNSPVFVLAHRLWGSAWVIVLVALFTSVFALALAASNASTRMWYNMARKGAMPKALGKVHPKYQTPTNAIIAQCVLTIGIGLGLGLCFGVENGFFLFALVSTLGILPVYIMGNVAVVKLFLTKQRVDFNLFLHMICPCFSTAAIIYVLYKSLIPLPAWPNSLAPWVVLVWFAIGLGVLISAKKSGRRNILTAVQAAAIDDEPPLLPSPASEN